jgi:hypothetical protein
MQSEESTRGYYAKKKKTEVNKGKLSSSIE